MKTLFRLFLLVLLLAAAGGAWLWREAQTFLDTVRIWKPP